VVAYDGGDGGGHLRHVFGVDLGFLDEAVHVAVDVVLDGHGTRGPAVVVGAAQQFGELCGEVGRHLYGEPVPEGVQPGAQDPVGEMAVVRSQGFRDRFEPDVRAVDGVLEVG
jgi:hypothetical protein